MFENIGNSDKKVIIVKGKGKETRYAQLLFQMISKLSGFEAPQPITEKEYELMVSTVDEQGKVDTGKVIFIGNGSEIETQGKSVNWRYSRFGMKYGWLGNRCVVTANDKSVSLKMQSDFADYYNSRVQEFMDLMELTEIDYSKTDTFEVDNNPLKWEESDSATDKAGKFVKNAPLAIFNSAKKEVINTVESTRAMSERKMLWKQQYELLVCNFILNGFEQFMDSTSDKITKGQAIIVYDVKDAEYAHLLHNLIHQYNGYDTAEYTEKMFIDNAKSLSSKNKIIFLGKTKSAKELNLVSSLAFSEHSMTYGWVANHAFIEVDKLKTAEREDFIQYYLLKSEEYEDKSKTYKERKSDNPTISPTAVGIGVGGFVPKLLFALPAVAVDVGVAVAADKIKSGIDTAKDLTMYQHHLLLREFVFNGLSEFMEGE